MSYYTLFALIQKLIKHHRIPHLAACDSVYEACDQLWIQRQTLHDVDGLT